MTDLLITLSIFDDFSAKALFEWFVNNASYLFVFIFMAIESSFVPFPSEIVVPPAVWLALTGRDDMNVAGIIFFATLGAVVGAVINYLLALWLGRPIVYGFANSRLGHLLLLDEDKVKRSEDYFRKHGASSTLIGRLIPAIRQLISIPAGLSRMNFWSFVAFTALGAGLWNGVLAFVGYLLSRICDTKEAAFNMVEKYNSYLTLGGLILLILCILYIVYQAMSAKKKKETDNDTTATSPES